MIAPFSLSKQMSFTLPTSWGELTEAQLLHVLEVLFIYRNDEDALAKAKVALILYFCNIEVDSATDCGFLCKEHTSGKTFILDKEYLPDMVSYLCWLDNPEEMTLRVERVGCYAAVDFELHSLMFGQYLSVDNFYQAYLSGGDEKNLLNMARILYRVPDNGEMEVFEGHILLGVMMWWMAVKKKLSMWFPNFLKPSEGSREVTRESIMEATRAQIRLLTGGDVTKEEYILTKVDTWTALAELDAKAQEAEEINKKYGNK